MNNFKKVLALVLALSMILSTFTVSFAADMTAGEVLKELNVLRGSGDGVTDAYLAETTTRKQAALMVLRLKGLEADATAYTGTEVFADTAEVTGFWAPILSYLKANPELGWIGNGEGNFRPDDTISAQAYYKVMLEALGYKQTTTDVEGDFTWAEVLTFAADKGLVDIADVAELTNMDFAKATVEALKATNKDGDVLVDKLVNDGVVARDKALATGLVEETGVLAVDSVSATNLKEAVVKFNMAGDKDKLGDKANYTVTSNTVEAAAVAADGMTVTLTLGTKIAQQGSVEVTVKKAAGLAADSKTKITGVVDVTLPVAEKIELTGPKTFEITFSEPVQNDTPSVVINNGLYGVSSKVLSTNGRKLTVTVAASLTDATTYTVKVKGYADFADFDVLETAFDLEYVKDATAPTVELVSASQTEVKVKFSKAVYKKGTTDDLDETYFYHSYTAWKPVDVTTTDNMTYTLKFKDDDAGTTDYYLPEGTSVVTVLAKVGDVTVTDAWGNALAADAKLTATVTVDATAPTVTKVEAKKENEVVVTFSEDVTPGTLADNFVIKDSDAKAISQTYTGDSAYADKAQTLVLSSKLSGGTYTIEIKDVKDTALSPNKIATVTMEFTVSDKTPATVASATVVETLNDDKVEYIYVTYSEAMGASAFDKAFYQLDGAALGTDDKVEMFMGDSKKVKITVADEDATLVSAARLTVGQVEDIAGNKIAALSTDIAVTADTAPSITKVKSLALNKVEITVDGLLDTATVTTEGVKIATDGASFYALASIDSVTKKDGKTTVVALIQHDGKLANPAAVFNGVTEHDKWKSETGKLAVVGVVTYSEGISPKFVAPSPVADAVADSGDDNVITLTFDETAIDVSSGLAEADITVVYDGKTLIPGTNYTVANAGGDTTLELTVQDVTAGKSIVVSVSGANYIVDANGNKISDFSQTYTAK